MVVGLKTFAFEVVVVGYIFVNNLPEFRVVKSNRRTLSLHIEADGTLVVKSPRLIFDWQIRRFVSEHNEWIEKNVARRRSGLDKRLEGEYFFVGKSLIFTPGKYSSIIVKGTELQFPLGLMFRKDKELTGWYIARAKEIITRQVEYYARIMKTEYKEITFSDTRSQWGRCTHDNRLQFSWRLVMAPLLVINYVVIHELSHIFEKNHTQMFWMKVRGQTPSYRQQIKWLKEHGAGLRV